MTTPTNDLEALAAVAIALCENALGGKRCPCKEAGKFNCADEYPGQQAQAALTALRAQDATPSARIMDDKDRENSVEGVHPSPNPAPQAVAADGELLPCPFCGGTDLTIEAYVVMPDDYHGGCVTCIDCDAQGPNGITLDGWLSNKEEAEAAARIAWNNYTRPTATNGDKDAVIADLRTMLQATAEAAATHLKDKIALREALEAVQPHLPAIICYASTTSEHGGNRVAALVDKALANRGEAGE